MRKGVGSILTLALALVLSRPAAAQEFPPTRVAVVNIGDVLRNYSKAKEAKEKMEAVVKPYKALSDKLREETVKLQQLVNSAEGEEKTTATQKLLAVRRKMEDLQTEVQRLIGKQQEQFITELYTDVKKAIQSHADAHNIDLVLAYGEPGPEDALKMPNINRKFSAADHGGVVPLFIRPRIDITQAVLQRLNEGYSAKK